MSGGYCSAVFYCGRQIQMKFQALAWRPGLEGLGREKGSKSCEKLCDKFTVAVAYSKVWSDSLVAPRALYDENYIEMNNKIFEFRYGKVSKSVVYCCLISSVPLSVTWLPWRPDLDRNGHWTRSIHSAYSMIVAGVPRYQLRLVPFSSSRWHEISCRPSCPECGRRRHTSVRRFSRIILSICPLRLPANACKGNGWFSRSGPR